MHQLGNDGLAHWVAYLLLAIMQMLKGSDPASDVHFAFLYFSRASSNMVHSAASPVRLHQLASG